MQDSEVQNGIRETQAIVLQAQHGQLWWGADLEVVERVHLGVGRKERERRHVLSCNQKCERGTKSELGIIRVLSPVGRLL